MQCYGLVIHKYKIVSPSILILLFFKYHHLYAYKEKNCKVGFVIKIWPVTHSSWFSRRCNNVNVKGTFCTFQSFSFRPFVKVNSNHLLLCLHLQENLLLRGMRSRLFILEHSQGCETFPCERHGHQSRRLGGKQDSGECRE